MNINLHYIVQWEKNKERTMHIVSITDDNYITPTLVAVTSLVNNSNKNNETNC